MIEAKKLINLPIAAVDGLRKIGSVYQIIVNPETGQLMGFLVSLGLFSKPKVLSFLDIKFWDENGLVTELEENLVEIDEIVRIKNVLNQKINLLEMSAKTESGKSLGLVENFLIETETGTVVKYYLKDLLGTSRIMPADKVIKIEKTIIFSDDEEKIPNTIAETVLA